jgi:tetratricopeptide (TPR) repeat protein
MEVSHPGELLVAAEVERARGMAARDDQDMTAAVTHLLRSIRFAERAGAVRTAADVRISLALALAYRGRIATALTELDRAAAVLSGFDLARVEFQRGAVRQIQGRLDEALHCYNRAQPLQAQAGDRAGLAMLHNNRGVVLLRRGALAAAEADLRRAVELNLELGQRRAAAEASENLGLVAARRGDVITALAAFDDVDRYLEDTGAVDAVGLLDRSEALLAARLLTEAQSTADRALAEMDKRELAAPVAEGRLVLAQIALLDGRLADARRLSEASAAEFGRQRRASFRAMAEAVGVRAAWAGGERTPELLTTAARLVRRLEQAGWAVAALDARLVAGQIALALGRTRTARSQLGPLAARKGDDPAEVRSRSFHARALLFLADDNRRRADLALRAGMAALERHREAIGGTELRANASAHAGDLARLGITLALSEQDPERVLRWAERWRASVLGLRPVRPPADEQLAAALNELRQVVHAQQDADGPDAERLLRRQASLERTVQRLARHSSSAARYRPSPPSGVAVRGALGDRSLVEFVDADGELHAVVLTPRRQTLHRLGPVDPVARSATMLRFWLRRLVHRFGPPGALATAERYADDEARRLDEMLLQPLTERLDGRPLVVVPTTVLHALPWSLLGSCAGRPTSVAPSTVWWQRAAGGRPAAASTSVVLVGGPDLPGGEAEVRDLAGLYADAASMVGPQATVAAVTSALDGAGLAHVATHGSFRADQPLLSSLQLADGPVTVYDLERLRQAPRWMVLASCDAGVSEVRPGDELMGLSAALLAQGTVALVAPLLPVPDDATRQTMLALHRALRTGATPAAALAAAVTQASQAGDGLNRFAAAAFVCLGAG